jgi:NAD(P)H-quinone oxidoreductase subunit 5
MVGVALLYGAWHAVAAHLVPTPAQKLNAIGWILAALCFTGLFAVKSALQLRPAGRWAQALHSWLFAGLYLDELFTRLTFRIWPPRIPRTVDLIPVFVPSPQTLDVRA